jgi:hypothetical protein
VKLIPHPLKGNQRCAATNRGTDPRGFIHTRNILSGWDQEVLISVAAVEEMGRMIGMVTQEEIEGYQADLKRMAAEIEAVTLRAEALEGIGSAVEVLREEVAA